MKDLFCACNLNTILGPQVWTNLLTLKTNISQTDKIHHLKSDHSHDIAAGDNFSTSAVTFNKATTNASKSTACKEKNA